MALYVLRVRERACSLETMALTEVSKNHILKNAVYLKKYLNYSYALTWYETTIHTLNPPKKDYTRYETMKSPAAIARLYPAAEMLPFSKISQYLDLRLDDKSTGKMSTATYQELHRRNCIQVEGFLSMDLQNPIHEIFRRERFIGIEGDEYNRLEPALKLASRFITEPE
jgi:hypothetical protein